ncbi:hypothetical protein EX30DRAFT_348536 [Ascodesmis nigricans]|uniref:Uncharacterized protein n=1 Tax=Ascodesmis nigricans TaxID=341454 RepID=A0A4S2MYA7_9PEZI|nr:hypothetical protein EX30DRAFT_348536 [Ascodesmis nigricans]
MLPKSIFYFLRAALLSTTLAAPTHGSVDKGEKIPSGSVQAGQPAQVSAAAAATQYSDLRPQLVQSDEAKAKRLRSWTIDTADEGGPDIPPSPPSPDSGTEDQIKKAEMGYHYMDP